jgi:hypothetical protein
MKIRNSLAALALAGAILSPVKAAVVTVIDYPAASGGYRDAYVNPLAFTFTTGTGSSVAPITGIRVYGSASVSGSVNVNLYQGSVTGTLLGTSTLGYTGTGFGFADLTLTGLTSTSGIGAVSLSSSTTYVLTFDGLAIGAGAPLISLSDYITTGGWSVQGSAYLQGSTWTPWSKAAVSITTGSATASGVPDAGSSAAGLGLAMAGLHLLRRRLHRPLNK